MNDYNGRNGNGYQPLPAPPTTESVGRVCKGDIRWGSACGKCQRCLDQMNNPPMLNSERKTLLDKITHLKEEKDLLSGAILRRVTGVINRSDFLTEEAKTELLKLIWEK